MTKETKSRILNLRQQGYGYKKIAKELSLTPSAIRYVCEAKNKEDELVDNCKNCGLPIRSILGKKKKKFCCDKCRMKWWNSHISDVKRQAFYSFKCKCCGKEFISYGKNNRVYCTHQCYIKDKVSKRGLPNG